MRKPGLAATTFLALVAIDLGFGPLLAAMISSVVGADFLSMLAIYMLLLAAREPVAWLQVLHFMRPTETLHRRADAGRQVRAEELRAADARLQSGPAQITRLGGGLSVAVPLVVVVLYAQLVGPLGLRALVTPVVGLLVAAVGAGVLAIYPILIAWITSGAARRNYSLARTLDVDLERKQKSIGGRLTLTALCLSLAPVFVFSGMSLSVKIEGNYDHAALKAQALSVTLALQPSQSVFDAVAESANGVTPFVIDAGNVQVAPGASLPPWATPEALARAVDGGLTPPDRKCALDALRLDDGRIVGAIVEMAPVDPNFLILLASVLLLLGSFGPVASWILTRSLSDPLMEMSSFARRVVERGDLSEMGHLSGALNDEVGIVTDHFNEVLDSMRSIAAAAEEVGRGKLGIELEGQGELPESFRRMLEQLRELATEMQSTSTELASAATEISAASQEQEAAATSHTTGITEISQTMDSLSDSASHVAKAVRGVLENAERTLQNTDQMVARIDDLTGHANRIGDILDIIREIADRTDLLALNGSLEASRAGEAGVGFSLVASEMRRLAERVTGSVSDIKQLVSDIRESGASTVVATEESKKLAQGTTEAARGITLVTQQQQSSTEQVSQNVRSVAEVTQQAATSTAQTRTSAESLKEQADRLADLVVRFDLA